ncbi:MAG: hypothetical protein HUJ73_05010, partial [Eubacterium sp.]|nr:hypothetical protein [Eubacterium sp.]
VDLPLLSFDGILAMGSYTAMTEFYDTTLSGSFDQAPYQTVKDSLSDLPDMDPGSNWYDNIQFPCSFFKKGAAEEVSAPLNEAVLSVFSSFFAAAAACAKLSPEESEEKRRKGEDYVNGLFDKGGPTAEVFTKAMGAEAARAFYHETIFGTK